MFTNDEISNILSVISIFISLFALFNTIKSSFNPKIKIEPLFNSNTIKINNFFDYYLEKNPYMKCVSFILKFFTFIPSLIYKRLNSIMNREKAPYGIQYCRFNRNDIILWIRIHNASKYSLSIYNIINDSTRFLYFIYPLNETYFENVFISLGHQHNSKLIDLHYDEFLQLPITIEPFSCVEKYVLLKQSNSLLPPTRKILQPKFIRLKVKFMTPSKHFTKKIKVYNGNKIYKNTHIIVTFMNLKKIEEKQVEGNL